MISDIPLPVNQYNHSPLGRRARGLGGVSEWYTNYLQYIFHTIERSIYNVKELPLLSMQTEIL